VQAQTWLTAIMVVVAGIPRTACACTFCDGGAPRQEAAASATCCCGGSGCVGTAEDLKGSHRRAGHCCCGVGGRRHNSSNPAGDKLAAKSKPAGQLQIPSCLQKPASQPVFACSHAFAEGQTQPLGFSFVLVLPSPKAVPIKWHRPGVPDSVAHPTTDLVVVLQHFLI
jgi:hypothetical protein